MITSRNYLNAAASALELAAKGVRLSARPASPLGGLVEASENIFDLDSVSAEKQSTLLAQIWSNAKASSSAVGDATAEQRSYSVESATGNGNESSVHSKLVMALADDLSPLILAQISQAKNEVAPAVMDLVEKMTGFLQSRPTDPRSTCNIVPRAVPLLIKDEGFMGDIEGLATGEVPYGYLPFTCPKNVDDDFFKKVVDLGSDRLTKLVVEDWLGSRGLALIKGVYFSMFAMDYDLAKREAGDLACLWWPDDPSRTGNVYDTLDVCIAAMLIANRLLADTVDIPGVSLQQYKDGLVKMRDFAGSNIWRCARVISRQLESKQLVVESDYRLRRCTVNAEVWEEYLNEGGSPEAVLGVLVSGEKIFSSSVILEKKEQLVAAWESFVMLSQADLRGATLTGLKDFVKYEIMNSLKNPTPTEIDYQSVDATYKQKVIAKIEDEIQKLDHRFLENIEHTALHLVANGRFFYTSAYDILYQMEVVSRENPNIEPRDAALLSAIHFIAKYIHTQIKVVK